MKIKVLLFLTTTFLAGCTYHVDSLVDAPDADPGDFTCAREIPEGSLSTGGDDGGLCTLRAAVMEANATIAEDVIIVPSGSYQLVLPNAAGGGSLTIIEDVIIQGEGKDNTIIDGHGSGSVFYIDEDAEATINNVTIQNGNSQFGGGVYLNEGELNMTDVIIRDNFGFTGGGGLLVNTDGDTTIRRAAILSNSATGAFGGGLLNKGILKIYDSTIANNESNRAGGIYNEGNMVLRNVTVSTNTATSPQAGTGGISQNGFAVLFNVTVTNNQGIGTDAASFLGGGIQTFDGKTTVIKNSIIAGNDGGNGSNDCDGQLSGDSRNNLIGDDNGCVITSHVATYLLNVEPLLSTLSNHGGPTQTHTLLTGSPARGAGFAFPPPAINACESTDQRGVPRPQGGNDCDLGAVEITNASSYVTDLILVDAVADTDIGPLLHGQILVLDDLPAELSIRAQVSPFPGSIVFSFDDVDNFQTENISPYTLGGDSGGNFSPVTLETGEHTLTAIPFASANGGGNAGGGRTIQFEVR